MSILRATEQYKKKVLIEIPGGMFIFGLIIYQQIHLKKSCMYMVN